MNDYDPIHHERDPRTAIAWLERRAPVRRTRFSGGSLVWRTWGEGPPVLLLHGASGSWTHWVRNVGSLAERFRVVVPDMPGFGESDALAGEQTVEALADALSAGLEAVVPPPTDVDVAGFSFGGIVGGHVAARLGERVRTLVLLGTGGLGLGPGPKVPLVGTRPEMTPSEVGAVHRQNLQRLMIADPDRADDLAVFVHQENVGRTRFRSGAIPGSDALLRVLPDVKARLAAIWGGSDALMGPLRDESRRILSSIRPDLEFRVIAGAGHWVQFEAAGEVNAALRDLLGAHPARS
jgi:pimeloyl-ACP methyl ester carboxylesterase